MMQRALSGIRDWPMARIALWVTVGLTLLSALHPALRYGKYLTLAVLPLLWLCTPNRRFHGQDLLAPFLLLIALTVLTAWKTTVPGWKDSVFILAYCLPFLLFAPARLSVAGLNGLVFLTYVVATLIAGEYQLNFSLVKSATVAESPMSFVAGLFLLYWLCEKKTRMSWGLIALNVLFLLLSMKRAALLGLVAAGVVLVLPAVWRRYLLHPLVMVVVNLGLVAAFVLLATGYWDAALATHHIVLRCPPDAAQCFDASNGRLALVADIAQALRTDPMAFLWHGAGAGSGYAMMKSVAVQTGNLHNDMLKIAYEFGVIAFAAFIALLYRVRTPLALAFAIYLNVVFYFDNILIYTGVMVFVGLLLAQARLRTQ